MNYDFAGWATKNDLKCSDGRVIRKDAFKEDSGRTVPLVWNHGHTDPFNVLGQALLENRKDGVYAYCSFNDTEPGKQAKELVKHGDICSLSICANGLKQNGPNVLHGIIREVSLVLASANPGASIETVMMHSDTDEEEAIIYPNEPLELYHADDKGGEKMAEEKDNKNTDKNKDNMTVQDVVDSMNEDQKNVMYALIAQVLDEQNKNKDGKDEEDKDMKHNVFDNEDDKADDVLMHDAMEAIIKDGKRFGSLKESFLQHAEEYGISNIDYLFPDVKSLNNQPEFISRDMGWVSDVMNGVHRTPFSRIKSQFANITEDEARAKGYLKGKYKKEEVFSLLKRTTNPTTVYKKQKLDRDDVVDITDFDVIAWLKTEMRMMLDEELARAILIGDGRLSSSDDKINEQCIRPILSDESLFVIRHHNESVTPSGLIDDAVRARVSYKGSGNPTAFMTEGLLTEMLLLKDELGHRLYKNASEVAEAMRVTKISTVPLMEGLKDSESRNVYCIIVNMKDYNVGADKGGSINMFDDFDIDYNQMKYLMETRCSGALIKPYSAIVLTGAEA